MISFLQVSDANDLNQFGLVSNILDQFDLQIIVLIWSHLNKHQVCFCRSLWLLLHVTTVHITTTCSLVCAEGCFFKQLCKAAASFHYCLNVFGYKTSLADDAVGQWLVSLPSLKEKSNSLCNLFSRPVGES